MPKKQKKAYSAKEYPVYEEWQLERIAKKGTLGPIDSRAMRKARQRDGRDKFKAKNCDRGRRV